MNSADDPKRERASTGGWYPWLAGGVVQFWKIGTRATFAGLVLVLLVPLYSAVFDKSFVIGEFSVPDELQKKGITSAVVGRRFFDHIADMQRYAKSAVAESHFGPQAFASTGTSSQVTDIKLPGADISLVSLISQLRALLHIEDTKIVGEVIIFKSAPEVTYLLRAHATGGDVWVEEEKGADIDAVVRSVATSLVERFDPLVAGFYYFRHPEKRDLDKAIGFAEGFHARDKRQQAWALILRGLAWRDKQKNSENARVSLCAAIDRDPSFTPAWRILARSLREDGAFAQARHLALRLVQDHRDEPEGYRQLGTLRGDCMAGGEQEQQAESFFKRAIDLGAQRQSDSLSGVDFARFRYEWYKPPSSPPDGSVDVPSNMDIAGNYLKTAQPIAPDEPSIYTSWARILAHPRAPGQRRDALESSRLLDAELKAHYALTRDSTSAFANFVMGELLTDKGVEQHKYNDLDSFIRAKDFLETSRGNAVHPELLDDPIYARALAGAGDFFPAEEILKGILTKGSPNPLAEWVYGEMLYNQARDEEALAHLKAAESVRTCGPRSNIVRNLITIVEAKLANQRPTESEQWESTKTELVADAMVTRRSAATAPPKRAIKPLPAAAPACPGWDKIEGDELSPWWPARPGWSFFEAG
jgi:tetratricopeptide (TPR) repeat protein